MDKMQLVRDYNVIATEINIIKEHTNKLLLNSAVEIGKRLKEAKQLAGHGNWTKWLEEEVNYSQRTASNLMRIYDEYNQKSLESEIGNQITNLGYTQAISMLKLDFEERENFLIENNIDEMSTRELEEAIKEKTDLLREKAELKTLLEEHAEKESKTAKELQEKIEKIESYEKLIREKAEEEKQLKALIESKVQTTSPEELSRLKEEVDKKAQEIKVLKNQLKEKPKEIEVEVEKIVETVPEYLQEELNNLKAKLELTNSKLNSSESIAKFKSTFGILVNLFNDLLETLEQIEKEEPEEHEKYKAAVNKFLEKLMIQD